MHQPIVKIPNDWQLKPIHWLWIYRKMLFFSILPILAHCLLNLGGTKWRLKIMYDRRFFQTKLGQASLASIAAMVAFVALSTQMHVTPAYSAIAAAPGVLVEMA